MVKCATDTSLQQGSTVFTKAEAEQALARYLSLRKALDEALREAETLAMGAVADQIAAAKAALLENTTQLGPVEFGKATAASD